uniref:TSA: Wollemia nobilis Ref_Wollemi_Transcript_11718_1515 transcribed RNA sequence n=1 Tax=Wollemia nobilis TaxID=56998 RepID=A0A0C9S8C0_9CONI
MAKKKMVLWALFTWAWAWRVCGVGDPEDVACLSGVRGSIQDPAVKLTQWTKQKLQQPCNGTFSELEGVTCNNERVYKLSFAGFGLTGKISPFISNCTNLQSLDLSANHLSGEIPTETQNLVNLAVLNLSANELSGSIPPQLTVCAYLNIIDLHNNKLTGVIPPQLGLLQRLSAFDVSNNNLQGMIPTTLVNRTVNLPRFNASSFIGNKELWGYPLPPPKNRGLSVLAIVGIGLGSGLLSLVVSFTAVCIWLRVTEQGLAAEEGKITQLMPEY